MNQEDVRSSNLARIMTCAGVLFFKDIPKEEPSPYAAEGTAAGEYLERLLVGKPVAVGEFASNGVQFDDDMAYYTQEIANEINSNRESEVLCETKVDWYTRSGVRIGASYDASFVRDGKLYIDDLKYGYRIVEPEENWQLLSYAIGETLRRGQGFHSYVLRIHQPRPHHEVGPTRAWEISYDQLIEYKERIETRFDEIVNGHKDLNTSKHCKYCKATNYCPAFSKMFYAGIEMTHAFVQDNIDEEAISKQLDLLDRIGEVLKIKRDSLTELAINRVKSGKLIPNYVTKDRLGDRKWKKEISPEVIQMLTGKDVTEKVMLSPAKAEKIGVPKELVATMVDRPWLGQKLEKCDTSKLGDQIFGTDPNKQTWSIKK